MTGCLIIIQLLINNYKYSRRWATSGDAARQCSGNLLSNLASIMVRFYYPRRFTVLFHAEHRLPSNLTHINVSSFITQLNVYDIFISFEFISSSLFNVLLFFSFSASFEFHITFVFCIVYNCIARTTPHREYPNKTNPLAKNMFWIWVSYWLGTSFTFREVKFFSYLQF